MGRMVASPHQGAAMSLLTALLGQAVLPLQERETIVRQAAAVRLMVLTVEMQTTQVITTVAVKGQMPL